MGVLRSGRRFPAGAFVPLALLAFLVVMVPAGIATATASQAGAASLGGGFSSLSPVRILDTRSGIGAVGPVPGGKAIAIQVAGRGGVPSAGVGAVVLNVTATQPMASGYLTVYPDGAARPTASNLNFLAGRTVPNLVVATVDGDGKVDVYNGSVGSVQVVADVSGWFAAGSPGPGGYAGLAPARIADSRVRLGLSGAIGAGQTGLVGPVRGHVGVPASAVGAVVLNVTVTQPANAGYLTVYRDAGLGRPSASDLNFGPGQTVANVVVVPIDDWDEIGFYNGSPGTVQVVADVEGWIATPTPGGGGLFAMPAVRFMDSRTNTGATGPVGPGQTASLGVAGRGGVPSSGAAAVVLNVTVTGPKAAGYLTVYPDGVVRPGTSNLNFSSGQTVPNLVIASVGGDGKINLFNGSSGTVQIIVDALAWIAPGTGTTPWGMPHQIDPVQGHPNSVSCPTPTFCVAVDSGGDAITYNGTTWGPPVAIDSSGGGLNSVSCPTAAFCAAVDATGSALIYDGTTWTSPLSIDGGGGGVTSVSCATPSWCVALGYYGDRMTYDGATWSTPAPDRIYAVNLSCPTVNFCAALLADDSQIETYDGTTWTPQPTFGGTAVNEHEGVSCVDSSFCVVVADNAYVYDGTGWTSSGRIDPHGLAAVSCASTTFCVAVDVFGNELTYDGSTWTSPAGIDSVGQQLTSVSCPTTTFCAAVDALGNALTSNARAWTDATTIDPAGGSPTAVSCPTTTFCVAVDSAGDAITYNGTTWSVPTATPIDRYGGGLTAVSCPTPSFCAAADSAGNALTYDGKAWTSPLTIDATDRLLVSVSCPSSNFCLAISQYGDAMAYTDGSWSPPTNIDATDRYPQMASLSCATTTFCVAINNGSAYTYNGSSWSPPVGVDPDIYNLTAVSCPTPTFCAAVGGSPSSYTGVEVTYNGLRWNTPTQITPDRYLTAVSCPTAAFCAAVGADFSNSIGTAVAFNGATWSPMASIEPTLQLAAVSCSTRNNCVAADSNPGNFIVSTS